MKRVYHLCPATPCILCVCACMRVYEIAIFFKKKNITKSLDVNKFSHNILCQHHFPVSTFNSQRSCTQCWKSPYYGSLLVTWYKKYFSARNIFFPQEIFFSARNIFFSARNMFFPQEINFSPQEIYFFRKKYFFPQEIFFSAKNIFLRKKYIFLHKKYIFFRKKYIFSARNIFFRKKYIFLRKKYFSPQEIFL